MIQDKRLVSVIIPAFNCERYLGEAIGSVVSQEYRSVEIIVVDDGSTDNTEAIAREFPTAVRYYKQSHAGAAAARNKGVSEVHGDLLAFLDADDIWLPDKLATQIRCLEANADLDMVFGHVREFSCAGSKYSEDLREYAPGYVPGTALIKRDSFLKVGAFSARWELGEFMDWYLRATEAGLSVLMLDEVVLLRRVHGDNLGIARKSARHNYAAIIKTALDRRRDAHEANRA